jgi:2-keto-4-pentenoate hydratase
MNDLHRREAAAVLWDAWRDGRVIGTLPAPLRPASRQEGYAIQALQEERSARPRVGWKIAATSAAGQKHINVDGPIAGRLLDERSHGEDAALLFGANRMKVVEPEFCFRFADTLGPRDGGWDAMEVLDAVAALHVAIEIPDSRFADFTAVGAAQLIADNACAHEFVLGAATNADWRAMDLARHTVSATVEGRCEREGVGSNVLGDPRAALTWLVNEVTGLGITIGVGEVVTTGTCAVPLPVEPGDRVRMDFGALGAVAMRFMRD